MKLLVYGINYYPELTGIGKYTGEMCEWLAAKEHDVEVITAMPYYPEWQVHPSYRGKRWFTETIKGVKVHRCPFFVPQEVSGKSRMLHELSFFLSSFVFWFRAFFKKYDAVICIYPPLCIGLLPVFYKWLYHCPLIFHIQDLQVDAARDLQIIKNQKLLRLFEHVEKFYLQQSTVITTISKGMRAKVIKKGFMGRKVKLFPNWVNTEKLQPIQQKKEWFKSIYGYAPHQKVILYSGNIGEKQGLDTVVDVAATLQTQQNNDIQFLIVGEGNAKKRLMSLVEEKQLHNIRFAPLVPSEELANLLNMADLHLVLQKKGATDLVMPSKLGNILSCGGVALIASEKESFLRKLSEEYQFGINAEPEDSSSLQSTIELYFSLQNSYYAQHARNYALQFLHIDPIIHAFEGMINHLVNDISIKAPIAKGQRVKTYERRVDIKIR